VLLLTICTEKRLLLAHLWSATLEMPFAAETLSDRAGFERDDDLRRAEREWVCKWTWQPQVSAIPTAVFIKHCYAEDVRLIGLGTSVLI